MSDGEGEHPSENNLEDARRKIEAWRIDYNNHRPHSSLNYMTPNEFARKQSAKESTAVAVDSLSNNAGNSNYPCYNKWG